MKHAVLVFAVIAGSMATICFAQSGQGAAAVIEQADAAYAEALDRAAKEHARTRQLELEKWVNATEKAMARATDAGDAEGVQRLTDALARSKRAGYVIEPTPKDAIRFQGNDYALIADPLPWHVAKRQCERMGGHLVTIESAEEEAFVIERFGQTQFWAGAGDAAEEGKWVWLNGRPFAAFDAKARFNNDRGREHGLYWRTNSGPPHWADGVEPAPLAYVCEWER